MKKDDFKQMEKEISEKEKFFKLYKLEKKWIKKAELAIIAMAAIVANSTVGYGVSG